ncbi:MAG: gliding motility-associated C-terminal domain-containing protein [Flavobacteriales bacterium]|nr:gliding motility-associated C-terminal domain-containing protein [Flavobacteriales bacterium]
MKKGLLSILVCLPFFGFSQFDMNWAFGNGYQLNFDSTPSVNAASLDVDPENTPSCISDLEGNLLFYSDANFVFDQGGSEMPNGNLSLYKNHSIIIPAPSSNPGKYYLIRSNTSTGLDYSLIDTSLNDGLGDVVAEQKEVVFGGNGGLLLSAIKADLSGYWLLVLDNENGNSNDLNITVYSVNNDGIETVSELSQFYQWVGWYPELDDVAISNDCSLIAASFKGHYIALFRFDSEEGVVFDPINNSIDNNGSFFETTELAFSPNSELLYSVSDGNNLVQYDITSWTASAISASATSINVNSNLISDIKLGPDQKMYIFDESNSEIDRLNAPDLMGTDADLEDAVFTEIDGNLSYFPNTVNPLCGLPLPSFQLNPQTVCLGDSAFFNFGFGASADSVQWNFGDIKAPDAESELFNPSYLYTTEGTYEVSADIWLSETLFELNSTVNVVPYPIAQLPDDFFLCEGENIEISGGEAFSYAWSTNENTESIVISEGGTYTLTLSNSGCLDSDTIEVTLLPVAAVNLGDDIIICDEDQVVLESPNSFGGTWSNASNEDLIVTQSGTYTYSVNNVCTQSSDQITVSFVSTPSPQLPEKIVACVGDSISLNTGISGSSYDWSTGEDSSSILFGDEGSLSVTVIYQGCPITAATLVERIPFLDPSSLSYPNVFSPNSDSKNQEFRPFLEDDPSYPVCAYPGVDIELEVYNRWGQKIQESLCFWSGEVDTGEQAVEGVYYYIMNITSTCNAKRKEIEVNGAVTLVR